MRSHWIHLPPPVLWLYLLWCQRPAWRHQEVWNLELICSTTCMLVWILDLAMISETSLFSDSNQQKIFMKHNKTQKMECFLFKFCLVSIIRTLIWTPWKSQIGRKLKKCKYDFLPSYHSFPWLTWVTKMNYLSDNIHYSLILSLNVTWLNQAAFTDTK